MSINWRQLLNHSLLAWVRFVERYNLPVALLIFFIAGGCLYYAVDNFRMNTSTSDMLSSELEWRQQDLLYEKHFPQYSNNILVVLEADTPDQAIDAAGVLYEKLQAQTELFNSVYYPEGLPFLRQSALLYLDTEELQDLADNLASIQPFLGRLTRDQSVRGLLDMLEEALQAKADGEDIDIDPLLERITEAFRAVNHDEFHRLSWQSLMSGENGETEERYRQFILLQPKLEFDGLLPGKAAIEKIRELSKEAGLETKYGVKVRLTGSTALAYEEMLSVSRGTGLAIIAALGIVVVILFLGLRSVWLVAASVLTLLAGLTITAAFAIFSVGELNLISIAFAVLYIGLGIDFAIHYCLRFRELLLQEHEKKPALEKTAVNIGKSLLLCATTTAIGFYAFMPTDYHGVAELGWISGSGMFISLIITLTLLPALLTLFPYRVESVTTQTCRLRTRFADLPITHRGTILKITAVLAVCSLISLFFLRFDPNTLNLQPKENESVRTYIDLMQDSDTSPWTGILIAKDAEHAQELKKSLEDLDVVDKVVWLEDFIPENQDEKLFIIDEMNLLFGTLPVTTDGIKPTKAETIIALESFSRSLEKHIESGHGNPLLVDLQEQVRILLSLAQDPDGSPDPGILKRLEKTLLASFPGRLEALMTSLEAEQVNIESLPDMLRAHWLSESRHYRLEIYPAEDLMDTEAMRRFVRDVQSVAPQVTGPAVINIEAGDAVMKAFREAFTYAFIVITLILLLLLRHKIDVAYILTPLVLAALFTGALSVLLGIPLNFANVIALPLLLGIGVDSGIHMMHRMRHAPPENGRLLATSSARAVIISALTTIFSIGNLALSPHPGTASMGVLLTIGISMVLVCILLVLPALLSGVMMKEQGGT